MTRTVITTPLGWAVAISSSLPGLGRGDAESVHAAQVRMSAGNFRGSLAQSLLRSSGLDESGHGNRCDCCCPVPLVQGQGLDLDLGGRAEEPIASSSPLSPPHAPQLLGVLWNEEDILWELPTPQGQPTYNVNLMGAGYSKARPSCLNAKQL